jgi:feruloyl-CoA synthase
MRQPGGAADRRNDRATATAWGRSEHVRRCLLLTSPPRLDHNETTDKGYINQSAVLRNRAAMVETLYQEPPDPDIIILR